VLTRHMTNPAEVRTLYQGLDALAQKAVQEATFDPNCMLHRDRFIARHGALPAFYEPSRDRDFYNHDDHKRPTHLRLFFPKYDWLPTDLRQLLLSFVAAPVAFALPTLAEPPRTIRQTWTTWKHDHSVEESVEVPLRIRLTSPEAEHDLRAVLRLIEAGRVRVSDKKR